MPVLLPAQNGRYDTIVIQDEGRRTWQCSRSGTLRRKQPMEKALIITPSRCTACRTCELACSFRHHLQFNPAKSNIHVSVYTNEATYVPLACFQCDEPFCMEVCPTGAIAEATVEGARVVRVDRDRCVGCKMCTLACPFGAIAYLEEGYVQKCELCDGQPECVTFCPTEALSFEEGAESALQKKRAYARRILETREEL